MSKQRPPLAVRMAPDGARGGATVAPLPGWIMGPIRASDPQDLESAAFRAGAALAHLQTLSLQAAVPRALWRARLALAAAEVCVGLSGRREGARALRDAVHLTRPGNSPGPAGLIWRQWAQAVARPVSVAHLARVAAIPAERIALCLDVVGGTPVDRAARAIEVVLADTPQAETAALILAEAVLAQAMGRDDLLPTLALALTARDLRLRGDALRAACHRAVVAGAGQAVPLAADLARRAVRLQAVLPSLRARGADRAVDLFLSHDALAPTALSALMSDRAARRLCDRLVTLGAVRELTGRPTFRLYGV